MRPLLAILAAGSILAAPTAFADTDRSAAIRDAVARALRLLQASSDRMDRQAICASCHNHMQVVEASVAARAKRIPLDEAAVSRRIAAIRSELELRREPSLVHGDLPGAQVVAAGVLSGAVRAGLPAGADTDAAVIYLLGKQTPDGTWNGGFARGSNGATPFIFTAQSIQALDAYAPLALRGRASAAIARARAWMLATPARNNEAMVGKLKGLVYAKAAASDIAAARAALAAAQRPDGGWAQEPELSSDAYATGNALVALKLGGMRARDPVYQRGVAWLLKTQAADGSWHVKTRSIPIQPPIDAGFPYGFDQWISAWGTALAAEALVEALP